MKKNSLSTFLNCRQKYQLILLLKIKNINVKSDFESEKYIPIFDILVVIPKNNKGKLFSLKKTKKINVTVIKYNNK